MCVLGLNKMNIWRIKGESWVGVFKSKLLPESLTVMVLHFSHKMSCSTSLVSDTAPVSQSTSEDRCWCLMGFLLCEWQLWGKDNNKKKKHNDHMCVRAAPTFHLFFFPSAEGLALDSLLIFCQFTSNSTFISFLSAAAETVSWPLYSSHHNIFNTLWLQNQIGASWRAPANVSLAVSHWSQ